MHKFKLIDKQNNSEKEFKNLKAISEHLGLEYALVCRIYRKDFSNKKRDHHKRLKNILEKLDIVDNEIKLNLNQNPDVNGPIMVVETNELS